MMDFYLAAALLTAWAGCCCFYLSSPNQCWRKRPWRARPARLSALVLLCLSLWLFGHTFQPLTAFFVFITNLMLMLLLMPHIGALRVIWRRQSHD